MGIVIAMEQALFKFHQFANVIRTKGFLNKDFVNEEHFEDIEYMYHLIADNEISLFFKDTNLISTIEVCYYEMGIFGFNTLNELRIFLLNTKTFIEKSSNVKQVFDLDLNIILKEEGNMTDKEYVIKLLLTEKVCIKDLFNIIPDLKELENFNQKHPAHHLDLLEHTMQVVNKVPKEIILRLAALLHDIGKLKVYKLGEDNYYHYKNHEIESSLTAQKILKKLGFEEDIIKKTCLLIEFHDSKTEPTMQSIIEKINKIGTKDLFEKLIVLQKADISAHAKRYADKKLFILNKIENVYINEVKINKKFYIS